MNKILSARWVADSLASLFAAVVNPAPKPGVRFPEITGRSDAVSIPTRHGDTPATVYSPSPDSGSRPAVYVNVHGGGFVIGHREQDDPRCRYLAAHANSLSSTSTTCWPHIGASRHRSSRSTTC